MGYKELISHLRKEGEEKIQQLWLDVKKEAEMVRSEASKKTADIKSKYVREKTASAKAEGESIIAEAQRKARDIRLLAETSLSEKLFSLAGSSLKDLRNDQYRDIFITLVREIPEYEWTEVKVNNEDINIAKECFPDAGILTDRTITGGMEVSGNEKRIHIVNTLEKRLERAWPDLLPRLMNDLHTEMKNDQTHSAP